MSRFIETIRFSGGKFQNIERHRKRILASLGGQPQWDADALFSEVSTPPIGAADNIYKVRVVYSLTMASVATELYTIRPVRSLKLVVDDKIMYDRKYEDRKELDSLFALRDSCDDVLIVKNGVVTDTSYANIIFRKGDQWVTPNSYLLNGTMRQYLLETERISEQRITPHDLTRFSHFKIINAMLREEGQESEVSNIR
ncbi:MAG TPA: aminotransferase class IV [Cyclobacteriaceae bacterium]|nr:aminotransferase class IV [Cyclobacteriaceae bacterium]